jgi:Flp pilus assembly pilin Flp
VAVPSGYFEFRISNFRRCQGGATAVEYVLLLIAFVLPMLWLMRVALLGSLIHHYRMVTYWIGLPFP